MLNTNICKFVASLNKKLKKFTLLNLIENKHILSMNSCQYYVICRLDIAKQKQKHTAHIHIHTHTHVNLGKQKLPNKTLS